MYFNKIPHPYNFVPWTEDARKECSLKLIDHGEDIFQVLLKDERRGEGNSCTSLIDATAINASAPSTQKVSLGKNGALWIEDDTAPVLSPHAELPFGVQNESWLWSFTIDPQMRFYGMGEKNIGFEKSGKRSRFWNTDVWADFADDQIANGITDPMYASFPVLIIKQPDLWIALILPTSAPVFMDTGARQVIEGVADSEGEQRFFYLGASGSSPEMYVLIDADPLELTGKIQRICGTVPRPPLWALGYHQSRWGYTSSEQLVSLDQRFCEHGIPCDGLWLDIDYMCDYRVFTIDESRFPDLDEVILQLSENGRRIVPILDPGVKVDRTYGICREGLENGFFCRTTEDRPFVGFVWPGASYFPDFQRQEVRSWWAAHSAELSSRGFPGFWIDMNDPSTGSVDPSGMLFDAGNLPHELYHNAYALGMAEATWNGLKTSSGHERPFVLSRSGTIGSSRYTALWTGDNISNYHHLEGGIQMILSLSISGMPFVGADVGGFGHDAWKENYIDWFKASYLLPVMRNHSADGTRPQEPWTFDEETLKITRGCIQARYRLLPYLYQQFIRLEKSGVPIIRPMIFQYPQDSRFEQEAAQFMIGEDLLQAPNLRAEGHGRAHEVIIPEGRWVDLYDGHMFTGPCETTVSESAEQLHLFARGAAVIPLTSPEVSLQSTADIDLSDVLFLIILDGQQDQEVHYSYLYDDGISDEYRQKGEESIELSITESDGKLRIRSNKPEIRIALLGQVESVTINDTVGKLSTEELPIPGMCCTIQRIDFQTG